MRFHEWEPIYCQILQDMGYDRESDESSVRVLKAVTANLDLVSEDEVSDLFSDEATVIGDSPSLESDISERGIHGTVVASGSSVVRLMCCGIVPDVIVTDLDGSIQEQIKASSSGSLTLIHAHGDNAELIRMYAPSFRGPVILTTQSKPDTIVVNYGGFTDGDRAVCTCQEFGVRHIHLRGFDFDNPNPKEGTDPQIKMKKLSWAERIIRMVSQKVDIEY